ncbi:MAG TPA: LLM class flavin-dependent oxidoreductase, partial [Thermomicrobiales bacterium]|nr:LLM class flavin-dependent oxidoreductase [Thermomicrobiales bacterium]
MSSPDRHVKFGYCLPIFANPGGRLFRTPGMEVLDGRRAVELGVRAENLGFDSLWMADHLMLGRDEAILEGWTTLSVLAGKTSRASLGLIHQGHYFRPASLTAKMIATLDVLSDGRVITFYDFGRQEREHSAYGLPYSADIEERVRETLHGLAAMRALWTADEPITAAFGDMKLQGAVCRPRPLQKPHPPIWFGEVETGLLQACAEFGQGWNSAPVSVSTMQQRIAMLRSACAQVARPFDDIEISLEMQVLIGSPEEIRRSIKQVLARSDSASVDPELLAMA